MQDQEIKIEEQELVEVQSTPADVDKKDHPVKKRRSGPVMWVILIVLIGVLGAILFTNPQISKWIQDAFSSIGESSQSRPSDSSYSRSEPVRSQPNNSSNTPTTLSEAQVMGGVTVFSIGLAPTITAISAVISVMLLMYIGSDLTKIKRDLKKIANNKREED